MTNQHQHRASININDDVKVKLTDSGRDVLAMQQLRRQQDADGYIKFQLWELMNVFGSYVYNGCSIPFTFNRILLAPFDSAMTDQHQHRATPEQWAFTESRGVGDPVYATCSCLLELRDRIQQLEASQPPRLPAPAPSPRPSSLVDRVIHAINPSLTPIFRSDRDEARAAIREVAAWIDERELKAQNYPDCLEASTADEVVGWLRNEADQ